jgi:CBS domain-containing protein
MSYPLVTLEPQQSISSLVECLKTHSFPDFPIVDASRGGESLQGIVARSHLLHVLSHKELFYNRDSPVYKALRFETMQKHSWAPSLESVENSLDPDDQSKMVDLSPYIEIAHNTFDRQGSAERAYELFRTMGLRSLIVTGVGRPVGVITRSDLYLLEEFGIDQGRLESHRDFDADYSSLS